MPIAFLDGIGRTRFTFSITGAIYEKFRYSQGAAEEAIHFQESAGLSLRDLLHRSCGRGGRIFVSVSSHLPDVAGNITPNASSRIYDDKGRLITTVHAEENRIPVPISQVPQNLQNAFVAAEDVRFYEHHGVDPRGILRAVFANLTSGNATGQGGSTITQQLARNAFLTQEQTLKRKLLEVVLAFEIESKYTKKQILEMYMNQIYFGQGCYGIQTAAHVYFGKDVKDLSLSQCAMLAGLPNSPNYYSPFRSLEAAKYRQGIVLDQMAKYGYISAADAQVAKAADVHLAKQDKGKSGAGMRSISSTMSSSPSAISMTRMRSTKKDCRSTPR